MRDVTENLCFFPPDLAAYSFCASVGREYFLQVLSVNQIQNAIASSHLIFTTGISLKKNPNDQIPIPK
jgi:hypothetical protein